MNKNLSGKTLQGENLEASARNEAPELFWVPFSLRREASKKKFTPLSNDHPQVICDIFWSLGKVGGTRCL